MGANTVIAWCHHTHNLAWGCTKVSAGCAHCYAETGSARYGDQVWGSNPRRTFGKEHWRRPLRWDAAAAKLGERHRVFSSSMCDNWEDHEQIEAEREKLWALIRATPNLDWLLLTKRAERIQDNLPEDWGPHGYHNVWLGVSIESQELAVRAEYLSAIPAVVRFISYEPALGPLSLDLSRIDWLIYGAESGPKFRKHDINWARDMRAACEASGTVFFYKQSNGYRTEMGIELDGEIVRAYPNPRLIPGSPKLDQPLFVENRPIKSF